MLPRVVAALLVLIMAAPACAADAAQAADKQIHFLAIGDLPLDGGFVSGGGLRSKALFDADKSEWERELRSAWRIDAFPSVVDGVTWKGEPVKVRLAGVEPNEFGKLWRVAQPPPSATDADPLIYWSGSLALTVRQPVKRVLEARDEHLIRTECVKTGHEMKQLVMVFEDAEGNSRANYYLDPLHDEDRADIADPDVAGNVRIDTISPSGATGIGLAACWYASVSKTGTWYRGPKPVAGPSAASRIELLLTKACLPQRCRPSASLAGTPKQSVARRVGSTANDDVARGRRFRLVSSFRECPASGR